MRFSGICHHLRCARSVDLDHGLNHCLKQHHWASWVDQRGRAGLGVGGQERKKSCGTLCGREGNCIQMGLTKERTHRKKWAALLALSQWQPALQQLCSFCFLPVRRACFRSVLPMMKDQVMESSGLSSEGQGTGHILMGTAGKFPTSALGGFS